MNSEKPEMQAGEATGEWMREYEKPVITSSPIRDTFMACGKCSSGAVEMSFCNLFPEIS